MPSSTTNVKPEWMNEECVAHIDRRKLDFLQTLVFENRNKSQKEMLPVLMNVVKMSREQNISFSDDEMQSIISALEKHSTPEELKMMHKIMEMKRKRK